MVLTTELVYRVHAVFPTQVGTPTNPQYGRTIHDSCVPLGLHASFQAASGMNSEKKTRGAWGYMGIGSQMVAATFVGTAIGWWLDSLTGWSPVFLVIFFLLGSAAGFVAVYRAFRDGEDKPQ